MNVAILNKHIDEYIKSLDESAGFNDIAERKERKAYYQIQIIHILKK